MYARIPKSGLIGGLYENASGIFIFYAVALKGIVLFFYLRSEGFQTKTPLSITCILQACLLPDTHEGIYRQVCRDSKDRDDDKPEAKMVTDRVRRMISMTAELTRYLGSQVTGED